MSVHLAVGWVFLSVPSSGLPAHSPVSSPPSMQVQLVSLANPAQTLSAAGSHRNDTAVTEAVPQPQPQTPGPAAARSSPPPQAPAQSPSEGGDSQAPAMSDAEFMAYRHRLGAHLARYRTYPGSAYKARRHGTVRVHLIMDSGGHVGQVWVAESSGHEDLDQETIDAVARAEPLPPFPRRWGQELSIVIPVDYNLE